jgi:hypothetical protein
MQYWPVEEKLTCVGGTVCPSNIPVKVPNSKIKNKKLNKEKSDSS